MMLLVQWQEGHPVYKQICPMISVRSPLRTPAPPRKWDHKKYYHVHHHQLSQWTSIWQTWVRLLLSPVYCTHQHCQEGHPSKIYSALHAGTFEPQMGQCTTMICVMSYYCLPQWWRPVCSHVCYLCQGGYVLIYSVSWCLLTRLLNNYWEIFCEMLWNGWT